MCKMKIKMKQVMVSYLILISVMLISSFVQAEVQTLGVFKVGDCVGLVQSCANCSYNTITSIQYPNSTLINLNVPMNKNGTFFNYDFCNASANGNYIVNGIGNPDGYDTIWAYNFEVTPSGLISTGGQAITYIVLILIVLFFFVLCLIGAIRYDGKNEYDIGGNLMSLNYGKYLKMGLFWLSIVFLWISFYLGWEVSNKVLMFDFVGDLFHTFFLVLTYLLAPSFLAFVFLAIVQWTADLKLWEMSKRGLKPR